MPEATHKVVAENNATNETTTIFVGSLVSCEELLSSIQATAWGGTHSNFRVEEV